jgi:hypothetical protein
MDEKTDGEQGLASGRGLEAVEQRFKRWRESRKRGDHIPPQLWEAAVGLAREHGVPRIANRLRLNAECLSRRMEGAASPAQAGKVDKADTEFVELFAAPAAVSAASGMREMRECVIELENARGAKMRVELNGAGLAGLAHLCRGFWGAA